MILSGFPLAGANRRSQDSQEEVGILTAMEISPLDLGGVELSVLAGCDSAIGSARAGEGILGLVRAFREAGSRRVVASLWAIDDRRTAQLMEEFYKIFLKKGQAPALALREASLAFRRRLTNEGRGEMPVEGRGVQPVRQLRIETGTYSQAWLWGAFVCYGPLR
jgi:CHAT domain-containing protein